MVASRFFRHSNRHRAVFVIEYRRHASESFHAPGSLVNSVGRLVSIAMREIDPGLPFLRQRDRHRLHKGQAPKGSKALFQTRQSRCLIHF